MERRSGPAMQGAPRARSPGAPDAELAQTFFNSVTRRVFSTVGVDDAIEYLDPPASPTRCPDAPPLYDTLHGLDRRHAALVRRILDASPGRCPTPTPERDAGSPVLIAPPASARRLAGRAGPRPIDVLRSVFYRNKGAYVVGRVRRGP